MCDEYSRADLDDRRASTVEIKFVRSHQLQACDLSALLSRPRRGQEAGRAVASAPRHCKMTDAQSMKQSSAHFTAHESNPGRTPALTLAASDAEEPLKAAAAETGDGVEDLGRHTGPWTLGLSPQAGLGLAPGLHRFSTPAGFTARALAATPSPIILWYV